jgi:hemoglobin-like flavoprotein
VLGPDSEFMAEILEGVGKRHKAMGVNPSFFPFMGQALIFALEKYLEAELTEEQRNAWEEVYECISNEIVKQILC